MHLINLQNIYTFTYKKHYFIHFCFLFLRTWKTFSVSSNHLFWFIYRIFFLFCFLLMDQVSGSFGILSSTFPSLYILFFQFWSTMNASQYQRVIVPVMCLPPCKLTPVLLSARIIFFGFHIKLYILNLQISWVNLTNVSSTSVHVFPNLFWKIYPLFGQASFELSSYNKKICWGRGWKWHLGLETTWLIINDNQLFKFSSLGLHIFCYIFHH